jgi:hypothetical protein
MASAPVLMPGAWVRAPCLPGWLQQGVPQPITSRQTGRTSEHGQSQPPRRGVRRTGEPLFWWHCHSRGTQSRPWLIWPLRTQVWSSQFSRSRAFGSMLPPSAQKLWPFFVRSARPMRRRRAVVAAARWSLLLCRPGHLCVQNIYKLNIL